MYHHIVIAVFTLLILLGMISVVLLHGYLAYRRVFGHT